MLFTCIPVANVFATEIDTGYNNNFCWGRNLEDDEEFRYYILDLSEDIWCDYGSSVTITPEDFGLMGDDLDGVSYYWYEVLFDEDKDDDIEVQLNTDETEPSLTIENVTYPRWVYLTVTGKYGNVATGSFRTCINGFDVEYPSTVEVESGKDTAITVKPYIEGGEIDISKIEFVWSKVTRDEKGCITECGYFNAATNETLTINTTEDVTLNCEVYFGDYLKQCFIEVKAVEPTTTESKPATTTASKPATYYCR